MIYPPKTVENGRRYQQFFSFEETCTGALKRRWLGFDWVGHGGYYGFTTVLLRGPFCFPMAFLRLFNGRKSMIFSTAAEEGPRRGRRGAEGTVSLYLTVNGLCLWR